MYTWKPNEANAKHDRIHTQALERTEDGWRRKRDEPEQPSSGANDLLAQRDEGGRVVLGTTRPRSAREGACGGT